MTKTRNRSLGAKKFYNIEKGNKDSGFFFFLPTIMLSPKKLLDWEILTFSIFISWGHFYLQINIFEIIRDTNTEVFKENMIKLMGFLKNNDLAIHDMPATLEFLKKNPYIVSLIKNSNLDHPYIQAIFLSNFQNVPFLKPLNPFNN